MACPWPIGDCPHPSACECDRIYNQGDPEPSLFQHGQRAIDEWRERQVKLKAYLATIRNQGEQG